MKPSKIPAALREWRIVRGLSQSQAAPIIGVSRRTLQNWEQGRNRPRGLALSALKRLLAAPPGMQPPPVQMGHRETLSEYLAAVDPTIAIQPFRTVRKS